MSRALTLRLLTAAVLLALVLALLARGSDRWVLGVFAAIALRAAWEWAALCPGLAGARRWWLVGALGAALAGAYWLPHAGAVPLFVAAVGWWALAATWVVRYPAVPQWLDQPPAQALIILLSLTAAWLALARLAVAERPLLLLCLAMVWAADSAAYLVGRRYGKRKLCPAVSPGKTVEGMLGGLAAAALVGLIAGMVMGWDAPRCAALAVVTTVCAAVSVIGDLAESLFKRRAGVKDSSHLLPGHGGVLDRIDALIAAAPLFALVAPLLVRD